MQLQTGVEPATHLFVALLSKLCSISDSSVLLLQNGNTVFTLPVCEVR